MSREQVAVRVQMVLVALGMVALGLLCGPALAHATSSSPAQAGNQVAGIMRDVAGPVFLGLMGVRGVGHYVSHDYGKAMGHFGLGALTAIPLYAPGELGSAFQAMAHTVAGGL